MNSGQFTSNSLIQFRGNGSPSSSSLLAVSVNIGKTFQPVSTFTFGTGSGQIDTILAQPFTLAASASTEHNLFNGSIVDIFGAANGLQTLKFLSIWLVDNTDGSTGASSITIGNAGTNPIQLNFGATTHTYTQYPDSQPFQAGRQSGYTVNAGACRVKVLNNDGANTATYWLVAAGVKV